MVTQQTTYHHHNDVGKNIVINGINLFDPVTKRKTYVDSLELDGCVHKSVIPITDLTGLVHSSSYTTSSGRSSIEAEAAGIVEILITYFVGYVFRNFCVKGYGSETTSILSPLVGRNNLASICSPASTTNLVKAIVLKELRNRFDGFIFPFSCSTQRCVLNKYKAVINVLRDMFDEAFTLKEVTKDYLYDEDVELSQLLNYISIEYPKEGIYEFYVFEPKYVFDKIIVSDEDYKSCLRIGKSKRFVYEHLIQPGHINSMYYVLMVRRCIYNNTNLVKVYRCWMLQSSNGIIFWNMYPGSVYYYKHVLYEFGINYLKAINSNHNNNNLLRYEYCLLNGKEYPILPHDVQRWLHKPSVEIELDDGTTSKLTLNVSSLPFSYSGMAVFENSESILGNMLLYTTEDSTGIKGDCDKAIVQKVYETILQSVSVTGACPHCMSSVSITDRTTLYDLVKHSAEQHSIHDQNSLV